MIHSFVRSCRCALSPVSRRGPSWQGRECGYPYGFIWPPRYIFGVKGPSLTCDTACSSSLVAADAASWKQSKASTAPPAPTPGHSRSCTNGSGPNHAQSLSMLVHSRRCLPFAGEQQKAPWLPEPTSFLVLARTSASARPGKFKSTDSLQTQDDIEGKCWYKEPIGTISSCSKLSGQDAFRGWPLLHLRCLGKWLRTWRGCGSSVPCRPGGWGRRRVRPSPAPGNGGKSGWGARRPSQPPTVHHSRQ